ncbi:MAG TPA: hypothetical protein VHX39_20335, partial [Acetobacteraceae bacterium]|nr:hypothetical protein [Acetobacteraceae bacterium]
MLDDIATWLTETWSGFVRFVEFNPGPLYATLLVVSALLFSITIGVFAARLRGLRVRTRQLS